jgi:hypothetical protein
MLGMLDDLISLQLRQMMTLQIFFGDFRICASTHCQWGNAAFMAWWVDLTVAEELLHQ